MRTLPLGCWLRRLAAVALGALLAPARASEDAALEWWSPALSTVKVYDLWGDSGEYDAARRPQLLASRSWGAKSWPPLILLGEGEETERENATASIHKANATVDHSKANLTGKVNGTQAANVNSTAVAGQKQIPQIVRQTWLEWVRLSMSFALVIKAACMASNIVFQASPLPVIKGFAETGCTGETDSAPFISIAYGSCQWCFYGLFAYIVTAKSGFLVLVYSNVAGAALGVYYVWAFITNCTNCEMRKRSDVYFQVLGAVAAVQVGGMAIMPPVKALFFSGLISSAWSIVGSMSMLTTVPIVLRTKSSKTLHLPLLMAAFVSSCLWLTCGIMLRDPWITVPNVCSIMTNTFALSLVWYYPPCSVDDMDYEEPEEVAPLVEESATAGDRELLSDRPSPLVRIIRTIRGQDLDQRPAMAAGYGTMKCPRVEQCSAGTGETF